MTKEIEIGYRRGDMNIFGDVPLSRTAWVGLIHSNVHLQKLEKGEAFFTNSPVTLVYIELELYVEISYKDF